MEYMVVDATGNAGVLLCVWKPEVFTLLACCCSKNFILLSGTTSSNFICNIVNVYAPIDMLKRRQLWKTLINIKSSFIYPWCIGGDFNEVRLIGKGSVVLGGMLG